MLEAETLRKQADAFIALADAEDALADANANLSRAEGENQITRETDPPRTVIVGDIAITITKEPGYRNFSYAAGKVVVDD